MKTNELMEAYLAEVNRLDPELTDHYRKTTAGVYRLSNGSFYAISTPQIKTDFCFGYSFLGDRSEDRANEMAEIARTDPDYFLKENLETFDKVLTSMMSVRASEVLLCPFLAPNGEPVGISMLRAKEAIKQKSYLCSEPTEDDLQIIRDALLEQRAAFKKRLETYLKRYGLRHLRIWTYWADE